MTEENMNTDRDDQTATTNETDTTTNVENDDNKSTKTPVKDSSVDLDEFERTRKALAKANKEAQERRHKLQEWEELGVDPDKVKSLLEDQRKAEIKRKEEEGRYQELLEELQNEKSEEVGRIKSEAEKQVEAMRNNLEKYFIDKTVTEALAAEGASTKLLGKHVKDQVKVIEEDGEFKTVVVDSEGNPRTKRGGAYFTVDDLVAEMKNDDDFAKAFPAPKTSGSGTTPGASDKASSGKNVSGKKRGEMSIEERAKLRAELGAEEYDRIPW